ncbi:hypothetical protein [Aquabacterium sp.]|uniref:hypothetical protein n=1 Tax=Aquabacterium sp. TaxID=1872578 RepID=UPI0025BA4B3A|nr:hypothetical protein [Aquabacterium sp.]
MAFGGVAMAGQHERLQEVTLDACAFKFTDRHYGRSSIDNESSVHSFSYIGKLIPGKTKRVAETWIRFTCEDTTEEVLDIYTSRTRSGYGQWSAPPSIDRKDMSYPQYLLLRGKNWDGAGVAVTTTAVDWDKRTRQLFFCLVHGPKALCGKVETLYYEAWPKDNALSYVLKFLQSIEFIDEPAPPAAASAP